MLRAFFVFIGNFFKATEKALEIASVELNKISEDMEDYAEKRKKELEEKKRILDVEAKYIYDEAVDLEREKRLAALRLSLERKSKEVIDK